MSSIDDEVEEIIRKYSSCAEDQRNKVTKSKRIKEQNNSTLEVDLTEEKNDESANLTKKLKQDVHRPTRYSNDVSILSEDSVYVSSEEQFKDLEHKAVKKIIPVPTSDYNEIQLLKNINTQNTKNLKKQEKEHTKLSRERKREEKKNEKLREKQLRLALQSENKNYKPEECMKFITAHLDLEFRSDKYSDVLKFLDEFGVKYKSESQLILSSITWSRSVQRHLVDDEGKLSLLTNDVQEKDLLIVMEVEDVVNRIADDTFVSYIKEIKDIYPDKRLSLGLFGFENYFKYTKCQRKLTPNVKKNKNEIKFQNFPVISRRDLENALTELQILTGTCCRFLETLHDVGLMIGNYTKAIAQAPYKLEKQQRNYLTECYVSENNKDCVRVDKNGNGLQRLWQQHITSFQNASLETAEAVMSRFPTLKSLFQAIDNTEKNFLEDLPIRRNAGPFSSVRRMGPEFSKKVYAFYNSTDGNLIL